MKKATTLMALALAMLFLASGMAIAAPKVINGTQGDDRINGTPSADTIFGKGGGDKISGRDGRDDIEGGIGADVINGGPGNDLIDGGPNNDRITGGSGKDVIEGISGSDFINVSDGEFDSVSCGTGNDTVVVDEVDLGNQSFEDFVRLTSCENVVVR